MAVTRHLRTMSAGLAAGVALFTFSPALAAGQPGDLDPSWGGTGWVATPFPGSAFSVAQGAAVHGVELSAVGIVGSLGPTGNDFGVSRYNKNGSLDQSFGNGGTTTTDFALGDDQATAAAYQGDKLVVVGFTTADAGLTYSWALARYNSNGSLDSTFGASGKVIRSFSGQDFADAVAVKGDKITVVGQVVGTGGKDFGVARFNKDGSLDSTFGVGGLTTTDFMGTDAANAVVYDGDKVVVAGYDNFGNPNTDFAIARYTKNGLLDPTFNGNGKQTTDFYGGQDAAHAVDVKGNSIVAVGEAQNTNGNQDFAAVEYDNYGNLDPHFNGTGKSLIDMGGDDRAFAGAFQENGAVIAVGSTPAGFGDEIAVARWTKGGQPDPGFGGGDGWSANNFGDFTGGLAIAQGQEQTIYAAGLVETGPNLSFLVARYNGKK